VLLIIALDPTLCNSKMVVLPQHKYVDVATCSNYVVGYTVGSRALLSATRYIFFLHCLEHYLRKLAPGSDINCYIVFTRIQMVPPTPVTIIFSQHQDVVYSVNAVPAGLSTRPSPPFTSIYRGKIATVWELLQIVIYNEMNSVGNTHRRLWERWKN